MASYHVRADGTITKENSGRTWNSRTQSSAIRRLRNFSRKPGKQGDNVYVHGRDGQVREEFTLGQRGPAGD